MIHRRPSVDQIQLATAELWGHRGTCARLRVGAVIARNGRTLATGYNGAPAGRPHCDCREGDTDPSTSCQIAVHAEANVIAFAAQHGVSTLGTTLYTTASPCRTCAGLVLNAGITRVVYSREFRDVAGVSLLRSAGLDVVYMTLPLELTTLAV